MANYLQPGQMSGTAVFSNGVLTFTGKLYCNAQVATSLADEASATTTVTQSGGVVTWVTVITPNSAVTTADDSVYSAPIHNTLAPFA